MCPTEYCAAINGPRLNQMSLLAPSRQQTALTVHHLPRGDGDVALQHEHTICVSTI